MKLLECFAIWYLRKLISMSRIILDRLLAHQLETPHPTLVVWRHDDYSGPERRKGERRKVEEWLERRGRGEELQDYEIRRLAPKIRGKEYGKSSLDDDRIRKEQDTCNQASCRIIARALQHQKRCRGQQWD